MKRLKKKQTVLVTGAAGFIGTNLTKRLLDLGYYIIGIDNFYSGSISNINLFKRNPGYSFIKHDIRKPIKISQPISTIFHLACPASPLIYQKNPIFTLETSILGTENILKLAQQKKAKIIQASTSEVYGDPIVHPQREDYWGNVNPIGFRSCYDESKRTAETLGWIFFNLGVDIRIIRIFNTYGPFMNPNDGRVVVNFIIQALNNQPLTVYGEGKQTRSFCYIDDLITGILGYMNLKEKYFGPINLGNPDEISILSLAKEILELIPESKSKVTFLPLPEDDPTCRQPDISRAKKLLKWEPRVSLKQGLKESINYFRKNYL